MGANQHSHDSLTYTGPCGLLGRRRRTNLKMSKNPSKLPLRMIKSLTNGNIADWIPKYSIMLGYTGTKNNYHRASYHLMNGMDTAQVIEYIPA
jgi:hypothetical protein